MSVKVNNLPSDFVPFREVNVCGNKMTGGKAPFVVGSNIPLLVGKNTHPKLWLSAPKDPKATDWIDLIIGGKAMHPQVKVLSSEDRREISVQFRRQSILELRVVTPDSVEIPFLDLRPVGLNIFGDSNVLNVATNALSANSFQGAYMVKLGK